MTVSSEWESIMELDQTRLNSIMTRFIEADVTGRHQQHNRILYTTIYGIDGDDPDLQTLFDIAIQNRARALGPSEYRALSTDFDPAHVIDADSRAEAFASLIDYQGLGPKIVDEFLRKVVHVFGVNEHWIPDLHVPLDTHVIKALIKTGAIDLEGEDWDEDLGRDYQRVVNMRPSREVSPTKRIGYFELQDGFAEAAEPHGLPRIVFDELWVEHSRFISNPLLQSLSPLSSLILPAFRQEDVNS